MSGVNISNIDHIGIAVKSLDQSLPFYRDVLGLEFLGYEEVTEQHVRAALFKVGQTRIELLESSSSDGPIAKHIQKRGEGIAHIAFAVPNAQQAVDTLIDQGVNMVDSIARKGVHDTQIAFAHPKSTGNVLMEFCSQNKK